ncbi:hypothetical protein JQC67_12475 [Aurantibacter crassamenti]|uniref:hypothetical protein n=1 Tax=Aurantibacter crassamenti TaxID=1837375 RepID=UPI00193A373F|nr:hypothetical protein [Aurantibacter crassamenti]MBM1106958.1 hypothetical protein [Aurantibacter crassamenti]
MKNTLQILTLWILGIGIGFAQSELPFFEQSAFDFYRMEILKINPVKKRISVYRYYMDFQDSNRYFAEGECLENPVFKNQIKKVDETAYGQNNIDSDKFELDFSKMDKKQFKIRKNGRGSYPKLFISYPMVSVKNPKRFFINVYENYERRANNYHIELDDKGKVIDWCNSYHETIVIH